MFSIGFFVSYWPTGNYTGYREGRANRIFGIFPERSGPPLWYLPRTRGRRHAGAPPDVQPEVRFMEFSTLLTPPVLAVAALLALVAGLIGYAVGKANEAKCKRAALAEAEKKARFDIDGLRLEQRETLEALRKDHAGELEQLRKEHAAQSEQANRVQQGLLETLKGSHAEEIARLGREHDALVDKLDAANTALLDGLKTEHAAQLADLKQEQQSTLQSLREEQAQTLAGVRRDSEQAVDQARQERDRRVEELQGFHARELDGLNGRLAELQGERERLNAEIGDLVKTIGRLEEEIKETRLQNVFSISKSGEKLVRVVRSVQELASELDETSRAVTGGEYSVFEAIKDQRDKDAVISLAGGAGAGADSADDLGESAIEGETES
jgi:hypothetical protein